MESCREHPSASIYKDDKGKLFCNVCDTFVGSLVQKETKVFFGKNIKIPKNGCPAHIQATIYRNNKDELFCSECGAYTGQL